jgi:hypothetical protein
MHRLKVSNSASVECEIKRQKIVWILVGELIAKRVGV